MKTEILPFSIELYDEVFALWQKCDGIGLSSADYRESIRAYLERNPGMSFVAASNLKVIGAVLAGHDGRRGYIHHLAVHPDHRRQRLAHRLTEHCLAALAAVGIQKCHIFVFNNNVDGIKFWKGLNWIHRSDISVMSKTIEFVTEQKRKGKRQ